MYRIFEPLKSDHPLIRKEPIEQKCAICGGAFAIGERLTLIPVNPLGIEVGSVRALPAHARCVFVGIPIQGHGVIDGVKDGDGSPYSITTTDGSQWTVDEFEKIVEGG